MVRKKRGNIVVIGDDCFEERNYLETILTTQGESDPGRGPVSMYEPYLTRVESLITQVGKADVPVLLRGETGAGKEVFARRLHECSPRSANPFVKVNCAALPSELVESELFGYERGAFSGAVQQRQGLFEIAHKGTILLDEIGDMDVLLQAKLLQVLQDGEFRRVGGRELVKVDVRVMAATHRNLLQAITDGRFREDLYYRLNVVTIQIPALRERKEEILPLAESFLKRYGGQTSETPEIPAFLQDAMGQYDWPGNVRELENTVRRFLIFQNPMQLADELMTMTSRMAKLGSRSEEDLVTEAALESPSKPQGSLLARAERMKTFAEREALLNALRSSQWNRKRAAAMLHVDYKALLYKMKKLGIGQPRTSGRGPEESGNGRHGAKSA